MVKKVKMGKFDHFYPPPFVEIENGMDLGEMLFKIIR